MSAGHFAVAVVIWVVLAAALLAVADGRTPVTGTAAAAGVVLLVANARAVARHQPAPFFEGASNRAETLLGASLVALAVASALDHVALFAGLLIAVLLSAGWVAVSVSKSESQV